MASIEQIMGILKQDKIKVAAQNAVTDTEALVSKPFVTAATLDERNETLYLFFDNGRSFTVTVRDSPRGKHSWVCDQTKSQGTVYGNMESIYTSLLRESGAEPAATKNNRKTDDNHNDKNNNDIGRTTAQKAKEEKNGCRVVIAPKIVTDTEALVSKPFVTAATLDERNETLYLFFDNGRYFTVTVRDYPRGKHSWVSDQTKSQGTVYGNMESIYTSLLRESRADDNESQDDLDANEAVHADDEDGAAVLNSLREQVKLAVEEVGDLPAEATSELVSNELLFQNISQQSSETILYNQLVKRIVVEAKQSRSADKRADRVAASKRLTKVRQLCLKMETTVGVRHVLRDCIGNAKGYALTCPWILNMMFSFFMLAVVTCINSHMLDLSFMMRPYIFSSDGCFYESITQCCQPTPQPADKPQKTCIRNEETFEHYSARWLEFVFNRSQVGNCTGMLYAIGGNRYENKIDSSAFLVVSNWENGDPNSHPSPSASPSPTSSASPTVIPASTPIGTTNTPSPSHTPQVSYSDLRQHFQTAHCPNPETCQRFLILNRLSANKTWRGGTSLSITVNYSIFIEVEWLLNDVNCRRNLRILPVLSTFEAGSPGYVYIVAGLLVSILVMFICSEWIISSQLFNQFIFNLISWLSPDQSISTLQLMFSRFIFSIRPRGNYLLYWGFWLVLIIACVVLIVVLSLWLAPSPYAFIILIIVSCINMGFFIFHVLRWLSSVLREAVTTRTSLEKKKIIAKWDEHVKEQIFGFNIPYTFFINNWGGAKLIAYGGCCCFFIFASSEIYQQQNSEPLKRFLLYAKLRPYFQIMQLVFAPIGLELVMYFPSFLCTTAKLPSVSYIWLIYIFVFMLLSSSDPLLPMTIDEITSAVISFTGQITTFLGPVDDVTYRTLVFIVACALVGLILKVPKEMDEEREEKPRRVMLALSLKQLTGPDATETTAESQEKQSSQQQP